MEINSFSAVEVNQKHHKANNQWMKAEEKASTSGKSPTLYANIMEPIMQKVSVWQEIQEVSATTQLPDCVKIQRKQRRNPKWKEEKCACVMWEQIVVVNKTVSVHSCGLNVLILR